MAKLKSSPHERIGYLNGYQDFKASLKAAIEAESPSEFELFDLRDILRIIDTCLPLKK
jgi:hypothetical protein